MSLNEIIAIASIYQRGFLIIIIGLFLVVLLIFIRIILVRLRTRKKIDTSKVKKFQNQDKRLIENAEVKPELNINTEPKDPMTTGIKKISFTRSQRAESFKGVSTEEFEQLIGSTGFVMFEMDELWADYTIKTIYMSLDCCNELNNYLNTENFVQIKNESSVIPEIGGILLGRFNPVDHSLYRISLEEFIPIESVNPDLFSLEFCTESLVKELGDVSEKYPHLTVMGWFHTHPGHGLFLSVPDMTIQMGFFREPYQIAMEIDSLSKNLDTGFFCQKSNGQVNNSSFEKKTWFSWHSIVELLNGQNI